MLNGEPGGDRTHDHLIKSRLNLTGDPCRHSEVDDWIDHDQGHFGGWNQPWGNLTAKQLPLDNFKVQETTNMAVARFILEAVNLGTSDLLHSPR